MKKKLVVTLLLVVLSVGSVTAALLSFGRVTDKLQAARASEPVNIEETEEETDEETDEETTPSPVPEEKTEEAEDKSEEMSEETESEEVAETPAAEVPTETPAAEEAAETPAAEAATETPTPTQEQTDPSKPVLTLTSDTIEIAAGSSFSVVSAVADVTDDKDDRSTLFRYIHVSGDYDLRTPGQYTLEYTVTDKDGNVSLPQTLTLIVK